MFGSKHIAISDDSEFPEYLSGYGRLRLHFCAPYSFALVRQLNQGWLCDTFWKSSQQDRRLRYASAYCEKAISQDICNSLPLTAAFYLPDLACCYRLFVSPYTYPDFYLSIA